MDFIFFKSSWIPASAGMTTKNHAFLIFVSPAKAGVQFEALKKNLPTDDVQTIMDSLVTTCALATCDLRSQIFCVIFFR